MGTWTSEERRALYRLQLRTLAQSRRYDAKYGTVEEPAEQDQPERFFCPTCGDEISGEYELCRGCAHEQHEEKRWEFWRD